MAEGAVDHELSFSVYTGTSNRDAMEDDVFGTGSVKAPSHMSSIPMGAVQCEDTRYASCSQNCGCKHLDLSLEKGNGTGKGT